MQNIAAILKEAGAALTDVVQCRVYLADSRDFEAMNNAYAAFFGDPKPARTTIGAALADGVMVEIDCLATVRETD